MTRPSLDGCWAKLRWAEHHLANLRDEIKCFEAASDYSITVEADPDAGRYSFYVHGLQPPERHWGLIIGDCAHNARCALDHLACQLVSLATGADPATMGDTAFPIHSDPEKFKGAVAWRLKDVQQDYKEVIKALQPFNASDTSIWGTAEGCIPSALPTLLGQLAELDNLDKHRIIHATWNRLEITFEPPVLPPGFPAPLQVRTASRLENGTKFGEWLFPTSLPDPEWRPSEVEVKRYFPINISLEHWFPGRPIHHDLAYHMAAVRAVLTIFEPVFAHGQPPLRPVDVVPLRPTEASDLFGRG